MGLHPIFQDITNSHRAIPDRLEGLRAVSEPLGRAMIQLDRAVARKAGKTVIQNLADVGGWKAPEEGTERYRMLEAALASRGMPYRFMGGEGCHDAWTLLRDCTSVATQRDPMEVTRDGPNVSEASARTAFTQWGLNEVRIRHAEPGDVLLFDIDGGVTAAIMSAPGGEMSWAMLPAQRSTEAKIIGAIKARSVCESWAGPYWTDKLCAAFSFDGSKGPTKARADLMAVVSDIVLGQAA